MNTMETLTFTSQEEANLYNTKLPAEKRGSVELAFWLEEGDEDLFIIAQIRVLCKDDEYREDILTGAAVTEEDLEQEHEPTEEEQRINQQVEAHFANRPERPPTEEELRAKVLRDRNK